MDSGNKISFTIVACTVLLALITLATSFLQMMKPSTVTALPTAQVIAQPTIMPTVQPTAQPTASPTSVSTKEMVSNQWEYLTLNYSQNSANFSSVDRYEWLVVKEPYQTAFFKTITKGCDLKSSDDSILNSRTQTCMASNFQGLEYFLNVLGKDKWEVISFDNTSDQYTYKVDLLFKRPVR